MSSVTPEMAHVPARPEIYHITHVDNLPGIVRAGVLWSDLKRIDLAPDCELVGMSSIKERRLNLPVKCHLPWELVETVGVLKPKIKDRVEAVLRRAAHRPAVQVKPSWYY